MFTPFSRIVALLLLLSVSFSGVGGALAQYDTLSDNREYLFGDTIDNDVETSEGTEVNDADEQRAAVIEPARVQTCTHLPESIVVIGFGAYTQCQHVPMAGIGRMDLIDLGVGGAADIWHILPSSVDVCFRQPGYLVFLDAAYSPRKLMPLLSFELDGMTCGRIDRAGTIVLLHAPYVFESPPGSPLTGCLIKLTETLFLRAGPAGEIIGLVWTNSEVPAFEINGDWYKIEFEGRTGYVSRYFRHVLNGACG